MDIQKAHCFFEQSGTFKNQFRALGIAADDYDIKNDFGETDHCIDLFCEIEKAYAGERSIFDGVKRDDLIIAFFPCVRFEAQIHMFFTGDHYSIRKWDDEKKICYAMKLHEELHALYMLICKLVLICVRGGYKLVIENPLTEPHYLSRYFPIKPKITDTDRTLNGDYYKKPTQYWFINCVPENNVLFEPISFVKTYRIENAERMKEREESRTVKRSLIHPQYASRFIRTYLLTEGANHGQKGHGQNL